MHAKPFVATGLFVCASDERAQTAQAYEKRALVLDTRVISHRVPQANTKTDVAALPRVIHSLIYQLSACLKPSDLVLHHTAFCILRAEGTLYVQLCPGRASTVLQTHTE